MLGAYSFIYKKLLQIFINNYIIRLYLFDFFIVDRCSLLKTAPKVLSFIYLFLLSMFNSSKNVIS